MNQIPFPNMPPLPAPDSRLLAPFQPGVRNKTAVVRDLSDDADPISVFFGKAAEMAIDTASFGIFQPDIVPDWAERASPLATTLGSIAGSVAGFAPSFGASSVAAKGILGMFRYTRRLQEAAKGLEAVQTVAKPFVKTLISGMKETGLTFAIHDAAREIVDQTKTNNPDIFEVAHKAVAGGLGGAVFGLGGKYSNYLSPVHQALTMGATMTMAEVITDAAAGEDVLSVEYAKERLPQAFLTGTLVGLWNSRGWEKRKEYLEEIPMAQMKAFYKQGNFLDEFGQLTPESYRFLDAVLNRAVKTPAKTTEKFVTEWGPTEAAPAKPKPPGKFSTTMTMLEKGGVEEYDIFKGLSPEVVAGIQLLAKRKGEAFNPNLKTDKNKLRSGQSRIKEMQKVIGLGDDDYRVLLRSVTGGMKDSTTKMSLEEMEFAYKEMTKPIVEAGKILYSKMTEPGWLEMSFSPADILVIRNGWKDIMAQPIGGKSKLILETELINPAIWGMRSKFERYYKEGDAKGVVPVTVEGEVAPAPTGQGIFKTAAKAFAKKKQTPREVDELFRRAVEDPTFDRTTLSPRMNKVVDDYTMFTDVMLARTNATLEAIGEKPVTKREFYMHHSIDRAAMIRAGAKRSEIPTQEFMGGSGKRIGNPFNPTVEARTGKLLYKLNPWEALESMVKYDLKTIYLEQPGRILKEKLSAMEKNGLLDPGTKTSMVKWYNTVILGQGSELTQKVGRQWNRWLEEGKTGQFFDKLAAEMNVNLGENPANALNHFLGANISRAFLGFRPKLALRNATQFMYGHAFRSMKNTALGLDPTLMEREPLMKEWWNTSIEPRLFRGKAGEEMVGITKGGVLNKADEMGFEWFRDSSVLSYKADAQGNFLQIMERFINPSKRHLGWADPEGIKLRKETGNNRLLTAREKDWLFKEMDELSNVSQFNYTVLGMPMITRNAIAAPFTKLLSFPMNYTYKYLGSMVNRMTTRTPLWAKDLGASAPKIEKSIAYGAIPKHFIGLSIFAAAMEATFGIDFASVVGISYNPTKDDEGKTRGIGGFKVGVFDIRPNPTTTLFLSLKDSFSNDERTRAMARKSLVNAAPIPYMLAAKDVKKLAETGEMKGYIFYEPRKPKQKKSRFVPFPEVMGGSKFNPFE